MGYLLLAGAIAAEVAATTAMKYSDGFTRPLPSLLTVLGYVLSSRCSPRPCGPSR
jgi:small multidrug resistance pump